MAAPTKSRDARAERPNDPPLLIMTSLAAGPKHGYALIRDIEEFAGVRLGPGTLYGAIGRLEERGVIEPAAPEGRARPYRLTPAGLEQLQRTLAELSSIVEEGVARLGGQPRSAPPRRANGLLGGLPARSLEGGRA
jgi:DNA-binding PadR family transcriptional regulator